MATFEKCKPFPGMGEWDEVEALERAREEEVLMDRLSRGQGDPDEPPPEGTAEYTEWLERRDDEDGYDMPENTTDDPMMINDMPTLFGMECGAVLLRRERRDLRRAAQDALGKQCGDRPGFVPAMPMKIADKRAEGTRHVEKTVEKTNDGAIEKTEGNASEFDSPDGGVNLGGQMSQNVTFCHTSTAELTQDQERAIMLLLIGKSDGAIGREIGVDRRTVMRWRQSREFKLALHKARLRVWVAGLDKVRAMVFESLAQLRKLLKDKESSDNRLRAVRMLVGLVGDKKLAPKLDEDDGLAARSL